MTPSTRPTSNETTFPPSVPGINPNYLHVAKRVTPGAALEMAGSFLKWYAVHEDDRPVPADVSALARDYLASRLEVQGLGFVILHRCGADFYFLIVSTWRGNNEVWETVFYKDGEEMTDFALFPREGEHKPTFCVWELAAVWHEKEAWVRFLKSQRDEPAMRVWQKSSYQGVAE